MFKANEIYEIYCEEREALKEYKEFEREHNTYELDYKLRQYMYEYDRCNVDELDSIPEVIEDLGENYQKQIDICYQLHQLRYKLEEKDDACLDKERDLCELLNELVLLINPLAVEELIAYAYKLRSMSDSAACILCSCSEYGNCPEDKCCSNWDDLEELLKHVSKKSLEEVVQEYCSNW